MRLGFSLPHFGPVASPQAIVEAAQQAEALGYDSLWTGDRLLFPIKPQTPYPGTPDGSLPPVFQQVLDPLEALTFAAAHGVATHENTLTSHRTLGGLPAGTCRPTADA